MRALLIWLICRKDQQKENINTLFKGGYIHVPQFCHYSDSSANWACFKYYSQLGIESSMINSTKTGSFLIPFQQCPLLSLPFCISCRLETSFHYRLHTQNCSQILTSQFKRYGMDHGYLLVLKHWSIVFLWFFSFWVLHFSLLFWLVFLCGLAGLVFLFGWFFFAGLVFLFEFYRTRFNFLWWRDDQ